MRRVLVATSVLVIVATSHAAGALDPGSLVLQEADVPRGFELNELASGVRSNAKRAEGEPGLPRLFSRAGRVTGYEAEFTRVEGLPARIESRVEVFRREEGTPAVLTAFDAAMRAAPAPGYRRSRAGVGTQAWLYTGGSPLAFAAVIWRYDRIVASVWTGGMSVARTLALARAQQRRIVAELR